MSVSSNLQLKKKPLVKGLFYSGIHSWWRRYFRIMERLERYLGLFELRKGLDWVGILDGGEGTLQEVGPLIGDGGLVLETAEPLSNIVIGFSGSTPLPCAD
jgi:hypothetical protein